MNKYPCIPIRHAAPYSTYIFYVKVADLQELLIYLSNIKLASMTEVFVKKFRC